MKKIAFLILTAISVTAFAQHGEERYVPETDPIVLEKLEQWQGLKFGLLMHWGPYSQWGIVESWSICPEDYGWCQRTKGENHKSYFDYVQEYEGLKTTFNPTKFNPESWAIAAKNAGMRYVVFTTKHHDGFCMFDSKYTDYKVTDEECPFSTNEKANIADEIFSAFRKEGLWTGAYFSKPDWHHENYWWPYFPPSDRNVNYAPEVYPERWEKYVQFTHNQIMELMTDYGKMDILWLDGGWVEKQSQEDLDNYYKGLHEETETGFIKKRVVSQDIRMDELVEKAREKQPGLIVVDRAVHGKNQNYLTPENRVPEKTLPYPWESCIIAGGGWSYAFNAKYMSAHEVVHMLIDIVAKGGNLLLNIAPSPEGTWDDGAYEMLKGVGKWMNVNSHAIYDTEALEPYKDENICLTQNENSVFLIYRMEEGESLPEKIETDIYIPNKKARISLSNMDTRIRWTEKAGKLVINVPKGVIRNTKNTPAVVFQISK